MRVLTSFFAINSAWDNQPMTCNFENFQTLDGAVVEVTINL
jgi:hypothetical protein